MNRILKYMKKPVQSSQNFSDIPDFPVMEQGKSPTQNSKNSDIKVCSFCGSSLEKTDFKAYSRPTFGRAAICSSCIDNFSVMSQFSKSFDIFWQDNPDYAPLEASILKALAGEDGSDKLKELMADAGIQLLKRSSSLLAGNSAVCPESGVPLKTRRIALVGKTAKICGDLLKTVCKEIGICFHRASAEDVASGLAYREITKFKTNGESTWAEHALLFSDGYAHPEAPCSVIFACEKAEGLPDDVEVIFVDDL